MAEQKKDKQSSVLARVRIHGNISRAARETEVPRRTINSWRQSDPVFKAGLEAALVEGRE